MVLLFKVLFYSMRGTNRIGRYKLLGRKGDNEFFLNPADNIDDDGDDAPVLNDDGTRFFDKRRYF